MERWLHREKTSNRARHTHLARLAALVATLVLSAWLVATAAARPAALTLNVGTIDSLTGLNAPVGSADVCGVRIAADVLNSGQVVQGIKANLTVADDQTNPAEAAHQASILTSQGIKLFVGGAASITILAELPILKDAGALATGGTSKSDAYLTGGGLVVRLNSPTSDDAKAVAYYLNSSLRPRTLFQVAAQGAFGSNTVNSLKQYVSPSISTTTVFVDATATNFDPVITQINQANPSAVMFIFGTADQQIAFMRAIKQAGYRGKVFAYPGNLSANQAIGAGGAATGVLTLDIYGPFLKNKANTLLRAAYKKYARTHSECSGKPLDRQLALSYAQMLVVGEAAARAKSSDPATIRSTLLAHSWKLPQGIVSFGADGQAHSRYTLIVGKGTSLVALPTPKKKK